MTDKDHYQPSHYAPDDWENGIVKEIREGRTEESGMKLDNYIESVICQRHKRPSLEELWTCWRLTKNPVSKASYKAAILSRTEELLTGERHERFTG